MSYKTSNSILHTPPSLVPGGSRATTELFVLHTLDLSQSYSALLHIVLLCWDTSGQGSTHGCLGWGWSFPRWLFNHDEGDRGPDCLLFKPVLPLAITLLSPPSAFDQVASESLPPSTVAVTRYPCQSAGLQWYPIRFKIAQKTWFPVHPNVFVICVGS